MLFSKQTARGGFRCRIHLLAGRETLWCFCYVDAGSASNDSCTLLPFPSERSPSSDNDMKKANAPSSTRTDMEKSEVSSSKSIDSNPFNAETATWKTAEEAGLVQRDIHGPKWFVTV